MKHVIVGTAGHIDHGKTSLVLALTGIDADRLKEEKQRGITIDIGFADLRLGDLQLGFIDVPGHERFVKNMLAGVHGIDLVLLVIAADESVMPQTREHFDICRLLGVGAGLVVLTKADMVDAELLELARAEVEEFVAGSFLDGAPIIPVSSTTGEGIEELKRALEALAATVPGRDTTRPLRLPVDRVFTIRGFGTVLTGTLVAGEVGVGESLELLPGGRRARVRGLQVHGHTTEHARAGQRTAVNLQGVDVGELDRGQVLASAGRFRASAMLDVRLKVLDTAPRPLEHRARVRFHIGTSEVIARLALLGREAIEPGGEAIAQARLETPTLALPGDRFIIRSYSPQATIAGGVVLDALAPKHRRSDTRALEWLEQLEAADERERVRLRLERAAERGLSLGELAEQTGLPDAGLLEHARALVAGGRVALVAESPPRWMEAGALASLRDASVAAVKAFHKRDPLAPGLPMEELRSALFAQVPAEVFRVVTGVLVEGERIERDRDVFRLAGRGTGLTAEDEAVKKKLEQAVRGAGFEAATLADVAARAGIAEARARKFYDLLAREGRLIRLGDLLFHREILDDLKARLRARKAVDPALDVAAFRELTGGLSRKFTIPLLEWLDRERVTRRVGDRREIL
jgi:selenocysteine-specific elongation factor